MKEVSTPVRPKVIYALALLLILLVSCQRPAPTNSIPSSRHSDAQTSSLLEPSEQSSVDVKVPNTSESLFGSSSEAVNLTTAIGSTTTNESDSNTTIAILYYVRTSFDDPSSQTGAFALWENAVKLATEMGQSVFDPDGRMLYTAAKATPEPTMPSSVLTELVPTKVPSPIPSPISSVDRLPNIRHGWPFPPSEETIFVLERYGAYAYGPVDSQTIYLTFNAGYEHNQNSLKILDILARQHVKAVFFLDGYYMESNPDTVRRMVGEGHLVGNHTRRHADLIALLDSGHEAAQAQVRGFDDLYRSITGFEPSKLFRPPSSEWSERSLAFVQHLGYRTYLFSWTHKDWLVDEQPPAETVLQKMKGQVFPGSILMLHSVSDTNVAILEDFITYVHQQGYSFALLPEGH